MKEYEDAFETILDYDAIDWLINYGKRLKPNSRAAYKKLLTAYIEYLIARYEDSKPSEPPQSEGD